MFSGIRKISEVLFDQAKLNAEEQSEHLSVSDLECDCFDCFTASSED